MITTVSPGGRIAIEGREGLELRAYQDQRGIWTIGYGHTSMAGPPHVNPGMVISRAQADQILSTDLAQWEHAVLGDLKRPATQNQFDALVSLCHNIGAGGFAGSAVVVAFNQDDIKGAADAFLHWEKPASLKNRRIGERKQFLTPDARPAAIAAAKPSKPVKRAA